MTKPEELHIASNIQEIECDEMWHFLQKESPKLWIIVEQRVSPNHRLWFITPSRFDSSLLLLISSGSINTL